MKSYSPIELHKKLFNEIKPLLHWDGIVDINEHKKKCESKLKELLGWDTNSKNAKPRRNLMNYQLHDYIFDITGIECV